MLKNADKTVTQKIVGVSLVIIAFFHFYNLNLSAYCGPTGLLNSLGRWDRST
jgi:hypothetical protein